MNSSVYCGHLQEDVSKYDLIGSDDDDDNEKDRSKSR